MDLRSEHTEFDVLAGKYLSGSALPEEVELLESLVKSDDEKKKLFYEIKRSWMLAASVRHSFDKEKAWKKLSLQTNIKQEAKVKPLYPSGIISKTMKIAAAIMILLTGSYVFYYMTQLREKTISSEKQLVEYVFEDGSKVSLGYNSTLKYPAKFKKDERRVKLEGEAFFEIAALKGSTFIVETKNAEIQVLGTSFWVKARKEEPVVEVAVYTGRVAMITADKKRIELEPGKRAVYDVEQEETVVEEEIEPNTLSWKTKLLIFDNTPLKAVFNNIGNTYGVDISIRDEVLYDCELTAIFDDRALEDVLIIIRETFNIQYVRFEEKILVVGESCK